MQRLEASTELPTFRRVQSEKSETRTLSTQGDASWRMTESSIDSNDLFANAGSTMALPSESRPQPVESSVGNALRAKLAGRELARIIPEEERQAAYEEHDRLTEKMFAEGLNPREERRLQYVRWTLDRIRDSEMGGELDELAAWIGVQEAIAADVTRFVETVRDAQQSTGRLRR